jgi:hypothetical protein
MLGSAVQSRTGSDQEVTRDSSTHRDADGSPGMSSAMSRPAQARPFGIHQDPRHRPSVPDLRVCSRPSGSAPAAPSVGRDPCCSRDRSPESVVIPAVLLPERFRAVLRLRRRPRPDSPAGLDASGDYKRGSARFPAADRQRALATQMAHAHRCTCSPKETHDDLPPLASIDTLIQSARH